MATDPRPKPEAPNWFFENIATLSHSARNIHLVYVGFLVYCALTIWSTPDRKIILNEQARLPLINLDIPFSSFVIAAPMVAVFIFIYFQLHVQVLKRAILEVSTEYSKPVKGRLYPWMIHLAEDPEIGAMGRLQMLMVHFSLWWLLPVVLFLFVIFTLKQHRDGLSYFEWLIFCTSVGLAFWLHNRYREIPTETKKSVRRTGWMAKHPYQVLICVVVFGIALFLLLIVPEESNLRMDLFDVDLSGQVLIRDEKERSGGFWAYLQGIQLQRANLTNTMLTHANLNNAHLDQVNLESANLEYASLYSAKLQGALLSNATLKHSDSRSANLANTSLICTDFSEASLDGANLTNAILIRANLSASRVTVDQLLTTRSLFGVILDKNLEDALKNIKSDLFKEPRPEADVIAEYNAIIDSNPISKWSTEPYDLGDPSRPSWAKPSIGKSVAELKNNDPVYSPFESRLFEKSFTAFVKREPYSVAEVRFFVTKRKINENGAPTLENSRFYVQTELLSRQWMNVSCSGTDTQKRN